MTFKRRLILLFCLLSVVIITTTAIGGWRLYRADLDAARVYQHRVVTLHRLNIIADLYADDIRKATTHLAAGRSTRELSLPVIREARDTAMTLWQSYRNRPKVGTEMLLSQEIEAAMGDIDLRIEALARAATDADMQMVIGVELEPYVDRLPGLFASLAEQQLIVAESDYREAHRAFTWGLVGVLAAAVGAILGLAFIVLTVIQQVTNPLRRALATTAANQAGAQISARAGGSHVDEVGAVIETLRQVRRSLSDATTQQEAQERLAKSFRAQLEAIFRHAPVGVYMKDLSGNMLMVSEAATRLWGHRHDEMIGKPDTSWSSPGEAAIISATNRQLLETGAPVTVEYRGEAPNTYEWLMSVKFPVRDETDKIVMMGGFDIDITERKQQEEELRLAATHLQTVKRLTKMFYWSRRVDARTRQSKAFHVDRELFLVTGRDDLSEDNATYAQQVIHPDDRAEIVAIYDAFESYKIDQYQVEYRLRRADGSYMPVRAWVERLRDSKTGDHLIAGVVQDISQQKQREAQLMAAKAKAEASNRAKNEFLTNMSHELRTPLNAVIGYSDLLKLNDIVQQHARLGDYVDAVNESGRSLLEIINAILDMARLDSSDRALHEKLFPLADALAEVERLMTPRARDKGVDLRFPKILPVLEVGQDQAYDQALTADSIDRSLLIHAEEHALRQILTNVLSNAIKFTTSGGTVTVAATIRPTGDLAITIADTGIGIDAQLIPLLTVPFTQAGSAWTRHKGGIGLGLAIARKLLELHQGYLEVESQRDRGTTVTLILPAARLGQRASDTIAAQQTLR